MRLTILTIALLGIAIGCNKDSPKHHVKEMIGTYEGTWTFTRNNGVTSEAGSIDVQQGSTKHTIYVGPEMVEFEMNEDLAPIMVGNQYRLSFPDGNTNVIRFERFWDEPYKDEFNGVKQKEN